MNVYGCAVYFQTEDQVDELTKELVKAKQLLVVTEEEKRGKEEEASQVSLNITEVSEKCLNENLCHCLNH